MKKLIEAGFQLKVLLASQFFQKFFMKSTDRLDFGLARHLKREGVEVVMLVPSSVSTTKIENGLKVYCIKPTPIVRSISYRVLKGSYILDMFIKSLTIVKKESIDLLHAFFAIPPGLAMALCKKATGRPLVLSVTGADIGIAEEITYGFRLNPVANKLVNLVLRNTDQTIVPSYRFKELAILAGANRKRITVIPGSVDLEDFQFVEKRLGELLTRTKFNIDSKERIVISLCRHTRVKGLNYLLNAMPRILREYPNVKLVLAGIGKETERLKGTTKSLKIDHNVIFPGFVRGEEKLKLLAAADIFVQPSLSDAFPLSALEAMASGKPVIITDKVGLADYLKNGECGLIVKSGSAEMLADAILKLLSDDNLRLRLGEEARRKAEEFSWDKITKRLFRVYYKALNTKTC